MATHVDALTEKKEGKGYRYFFIWMAPHLAHSTHETIIFERQDGANSELWANGAASLLMSQYERVSDESVQLPSAIRHSAVESEITCKRPMWLWRVEDKRIFYYFMRVPTKKRKKIRIADRKVFWFQCARLGICWRIDKISIKHSFRPASLCCVRRVANGSGIVDYMQSKNIERWRPAVEHFGWDRWACNARGGNVDSWDLPLRSTDYQKFRHWNSVRSSLPKASIASGKGAVRRLSRLM